MEITDYIRYCNVSGKLYWKQHPFKPQKVGAELRGSKPVDRMGVLVCFDGKYYNYHYLVWYMCHGCWPENKILHINGDKTQNNIENLEQITGKVIENREDLTQDILESVLSYNKDSGDFVWKKSVSQSCRKGSKAGTVSDGKGTNYITISISRNFFYAHRLAWLYVTGEWPENQIDHINGNGMDNRWVNLRLANFTENACNVGLRKNNTSGYKNVTWDKTCNKWLVQIQKDYVVRYAGWFDNLQDAVQISKVKRQEIHKEYARHD